MDAAKSMSNKSLRTMGHRIALGVAFVRHRSQSVSDQDWQEFMTDIGQHLERDQALRVLVKTDDAAPNSLQRNQLNQLVQSKGAHLRVAVMSSSRLVRGAVTAFSWMGSLQIRSVEPGDLRSALAFLDAPQVSTAEAARVLAEIEAGVG